MLKYLSKPVLKYQLKWKKKMKEEKTPSKVSCYK